MASLQVRRASKARSAMNRAKKEEERQRRVAIILEYAGFYSSRRIAEIMGCSANKIGKVAIANDLKRDGYGKVFLDKSPFSSKQVETFRYNANGIATLKSLIAGEDAA